MAYAGLPGSSASTNQSRSCANVTGRSPPRAAGAMASAPRRRAAAAQTVDLGRELARGPAARTTARSGSSTPNTCAHPRDHARGQQRVPAQVEEARPRAPTRSSRSISAQIPASTSSVGVRGATYAVRRRPRTPAPAAPCGPACRWASAGARPARRTRPGTMYSGRLRRRRARSASASASPTTYATSRFSPGASSAHDHPRVAHRRVRRQRGLDLARLDAEAADLHLLVQAAQELQRPVRAPPHPVARAVQPRARLAAEAGRGRSSPPSAPAGPGSRAPRPTPPTYSSPGTPTGTGCAGRVQHVDPRVRQRAGRWRRRTPVRSAAGGGGADGGLRRPVAVHATHGPGVHRVHRRRVHRFAARSPPCAAPAGRPRGSRRPAPTAARVATVTRPPRSVSQQPGTGEERLARRQHQRGAGEQRRRTPPPPPRRSETRRTAAPAAGVDPEAAAPARTPGVRHAPVLHRHALGRARCSRRCRSRTPGGSGETPRAGFSAAPRDLRTSSASTLTTATPSPAGSAAAQRLLRHQHGHGRVGQHERQPLRGIAPGPAARTRRPP